MLRKDGWHVISLWECGIKSGSARKTLLDFLRAT
jgi:G:T-mismatch repair DNA endonuclease (very short patch repair protein)